MVQEKISVGGRKKFAPQDILYLRGEVNYSTIFLKDGKKLLVSTTLKKLENRFIGKGFFRIHKSSLINLGCIKNYSSNVDGGTIELSNNQTFEVSRRKNRILKTILILNP